MSLRSIATLTFITAGLLLGGAAASAAPADIRIEPAVLDLSGEPREFLMFDLTITNTGEERGTLYPTIRDLTEDGAPEFEQVIGRDRAESLAHWVSLSRARTILDPGESLTIPVTIQINLWAEPGEYHAIIAFPSGRNREIAEKLIGSTNVTVLNVTVIDDAREALSLINFAATNTLSGSDNVVIEYTLENGGNRSITPTGSIVLYDRRGEKVGEISLNPEGLAIPPNDSAYMASIWESSLSTGRYKAFMDLDYGSVRPQSLQDTTFFWVIPLPMLSVILVLLFVVSSMGVSVWHRRYLLKHQLRIETWHRESSARHGSPRKQKIRGLPESPHRVDQSTPTQEAASPRPTLRGNILDLRSARSGEMKKKE